LEALPPNTKLPELQSKLSRIFTGKFDIEWIPSEDAPDRKVRIKLRKYSDYSCAIKNRVVSIDNFVFDFRTKNLPRIFLFFDGTLDEIDVRASDLKNSLAEVKIDNSRKTAIVW
jgi:hypothetical protein